MDKTMTEENNWSRYSQLSNARFDFTQQIAF